MFRGAREKEHWPEMVSNYPAKVYLFKVNNRNTRKGCGIRSILG